MLPLLFALLLVGPSLGADIVDTLKAEPKASSLVQLVVKAGLVDALRAGTHTVFAPTDAALARVDPKVLSGLLASPKDLAALLTYHVVDGGFYSNDLRNEEKLTSLQGEKLRVEIYDHNKVTAINGAAVSDPDVRADNGVIHFIDGVLIPPKGNIVDLVVADNDTSTLLSLIQQTGIASHFTSDPLTVFAPTNAAFAALDSDALKRLAGDKDRLIETLKYHSIGQTIYSIGAWNNEFPQSEDKRNDRLRIRIRGTTYYVNNAKILAGDMTASNGVVHKVDHVLFPPAVALWLRTGIGK